MDAVTDRVVIFGKALSTGVRVKVVRALLQRNMTVGALADELNIDIGTASHHVSILKASCLVTVQVEGREHLVRLSSEVAELLARLFERFEALEGE